MLGIPFSLLGYIFTGLETFFSMLNRKNQERIKRNEPARLLREEQIRLRKERKDLENRDRDEVRQEDLRRNRVLVAAIQLEVRNLKEWREKNTSRFRKIAFLDRGELSVTQMTSLIKLLGKVHGFFPISPRGGSCTGRCVCPDNGPVESGISCLSGCWTGVNSMPGMNSLDKCTNCECDCEFCTAARVQLSSMESLPYFIYQENKFENFTNGADFLTSVKYRKIAYKNSSSLKTKLLEHIENFSSGAEKIPIPSFIVIHVPKSGMRNWNDIHKTVEYFAKTFEVQRIVANSTEDRKTEELVCTGWFS